MCPTLSLTTTRHIHYHSANRVFLVQIERRAEHLQIKSQSCYAVPSLPRGRVLSQPAAASWCHSRGQRPESGPLQTPPATKCILRRLLQCNCCYIMTILLSHGEACLISSVSLPVHCRRGVSMQNDLRALLKSEPK